VARGVRPVALIGARPGDPDCVQETFARLKALASDATIPFVIPGTHPGTVEYGYAAAPWCVDLLQWTWSACPKSQRHRIVGLLLGYSADAIRRFDELEVGQRYLVGSSSSKCVPPQPSQGGNL
jgi:hypothetical protein